MEKNIFYFKDHHPLNLSIVKTAELFHDFIGPEQVSPHYENFLVARKYAIGIKKRECIFILIFRIYCWFICVECWSRNK